jgi:uncharacterized NAD(P)/FAD-binding protein YdhS
VLKYYLKRRAAAQEPAALQNLPLINSEQFARHQRVILYFEFKYIYMHEVYIAVQAMASSKLVNLS